MANSEFITVLAYHCHILTKMRKAGLNIKQLQSKKSGTKMATHNLLHPLKNGYYLQRYSQIRIFPNQVMMEHNEKRH